MEEITEKEHDERELKKYLNQSLMQFVRPSLFIPFFSL